MQEHFQNTSSVQRGNAVPSGWSTGQVRSSGGATETSELTFLAESTCIPRYWPLSVYFMEKLLSMRESIGMAA